MMDPEAGEGFKVTDRRRRPGVAGDASAPVEDVSGSGGPEPRAGEASRPEPGPSPGGGEAASLVGLFLTLGSGAAVALGAPDPATGDSRPDLTQAGEMIDLLILLRTRTEGNRTPQETQVLEDLIYDLQLRYVQVRKRSG